MASANDDHSDATSECKTWMRTLSNRLRGRSCLEREAARRLFNWREVMLSGITITDSCIMRLATTFPLTPTEVLHVAGAGHLCHAHVKSIIRIIRGVVADARSSASDGDFKFVVVEGPARPPRSNSGGSAVSLEPPHYFLSRGRTRSCSVRNHNQPAHHHRVAPEPSADAAKRDITTSVRPLVEEDLNEVGAKTSEGCVIGWFDGLDSLHECGREPVTTTKRVASIPAKPVGGRKALPVDEEELSATLREQAIQPPTPVHDLRALSSSLIPLEVVLPGAPQTPWPRRSKSRKLRAMIIAGVGAWVAASPNVWSSFNNFAAVPKAPTAPMTVLATTPIHTAVVRPLARK